MEAKSGEREIKVVYVDGTLKDGKVRAIRGVKIFEDEHSITIRRFDGILTIGKNFIIHIEDWGGRP